MNPDEFRAWRERERLSLRRAAAALGISLPTAHAYDRGYRPDDGRPVVIPEKIALACEALSARSAAAFSGSGEISQETQNVTPDENQKTIWNDLGMDERSSVFAALRARPSISEIPDQQIFQTRIGLFVPMAPEITSWLNEHAAGNHQVYIVGGFEGGDEPIVVIAIADVNAAFHFKFRWHGSNFEPDNQI